MTGGLINPQDKPWEDEPDYEYFTYAGVECMVQRVMSLGHVNGYILLPQVHPWYAVDNIRDVEMNFLWPVTFFKRFKCVFGYALVMGFDTMSNSYLPEVGEGDPSRYRTFAWVREQTCKLASEARATGKVKIPRSWRKPETHHWKYPWNLAAE